MFFASHHPSDKRIFSLLLIGALLITGIAVYAALGWRATSRPLQEQPITDALDQLTKDQDAFAQYRNQKADEHFNSIEALLELKDKVETAASSSAKQK